MTNTENSVALATATPHAAPDASDSKAYMKACTYSRSCNVELEFSFHEDFINRGEHGGQFAWTGLVEFRDCHTQEYIGRTFFDGKVYSSMAKAREGVSTALMAIVAELDSPNYIKPADVPRNHAALPRKMLPYIYNWTEFDDDIDGQWALYLEYIALCDETPGSGTKRWVRWMWKQDDGLEERCKKYAAWQKNFFLTDAHIQDFTKRLQEHIRNEADRTKPYKLKRQVLFDVPNSTIQQQISLANERLWLSKNMVQTSKTPDFILFDKDRTRIALDTVKYLVLHRGCTFAHASIAANAILSLHKRIIVGGPGGSFGFVDESMERKFFRHAALVIRGTPRDEKSPEDIVVDLVRDIYGYRGGMFSDESIAIAKQPVLKTGGQEAPTRDSKHRAEQIEEIYATWAVWRQPPRVAFDSEEPTAASNKQTTVELSPAMTNDTSAEKHDGGATSTERPLKKSRIDPAQPPSNSH